MSSLSGMSPDRSGNLRILICEPRMTSTDGLSVPTASSGSQTLMQWARLVAAASASMCHGRILFVPVSRRRKDRNAKKCQPSPKTRLGPTLDKLDHPSVSGSEIAIVALK